MKREEEERKREKSRRERTYLRVSVAEAYRERVWSGLVGRGRERRPWHMSGEERGAWA